jgi:hypothetical protein
MVRLKFLVTLFRMFLRMSLYCSGECCAQGEKDFAETASNLWPADADDSKQGGRSHDRAFRRRSCRSHAVRYLAGGIIGCHKPYD